MDPRAYLNPARLALAWVLIAALLGAPLAAPLGAQVPSVDSLRRVLPPVTFVFDALVLQRGAVADPGLRPSRNSFIVRVTAVGACPTDIGDFTGDTVTVWSESLTEPPVGARARFFAAGWALSSHLSLRAFTSVTLTADADAQLLDARYDSATRLDDQADLRQRARLAMFLVLGRVIEHRAVQPVRAPRDEHVTAYQELLVRIDSMRPVYSGLPDTLRVVARREVIASRITDSTLMGPPLLMFLHLPNEIPGFAAAYPAAKWLIADPADLRKASDFAQLGDAAPALGAPRALHRCAPRTAP